MKLLVFTAGFFDRDYDEKLSKLKASANKFDIKLNVYGRGEFFNFYDSKIVRLGNYIYERMENDGYTHCLFTDASDSFFLSEADQIIRKYQKLNSPLVVSAEKGCFPYGELSEEFPPSPTPYRFINAGGFIGEIKYILNVISKLKSYYFIDSNDNAHWIQAYLNKKIELTMDYDCLIFQTMSDCDFEKEFKFVEAMGAAKGPYYLFNKVTNTYPSVIHFNGPKQEGTPNRLLMEKVFAKIITDEVN